MMKVLSKSIRNCLIYFVRRWSVLAVMPFTDVKEIRSLRSENTLWYFN